MAGAPDQRNNGPRAEGGLATDPDLPPPAVDQARLDAEDRKWTPAKIALWAAIALLGGVAWFMLAIVRGETVNAIWFVFASVCTYLIGYRFYSKVIERYITKPDDRRATPAEYKADGKDYVRTDRNVLFGHHFAAIAGAGPLVGPVIAAQMGYLPGTIWIIIGVVLAGAVQDYLVLFFSMRRGGRSLGQMAREELGVIGGTAALVATLLIMVIIVAILALVVVNALGESPWGVFSVGMTIAWGLIVYGFIAAILPVWLLLAPRDYLSTFMKIGVIVMLALAIIVVRPEINVPAFSEFASRDNGPVFAGAVFPFLFVTIACGALSGFHALIASGTTPKLIEKERQTRLIGYGGMLMESFVAIMALVAAISIDHGIYFAMNAPLALTGGTVESAAQWVNGLGLAGVNITAGDLAQTAKDVGEQSIVSRSGGAPTLAVGLAHIMQQFIGGTALMAFWYHFAIMFEALFILTAVDAGTRVARFMLQDSIGNFVPKFKDHSWRPGAWLTTAVMVLAWGAVLLMGVTDPLGGINTLFPLFGIANQLLAAIALAVVLAIVAKRGLLKWAWIPAIPLLWDLIVTMTASFQKIFSPVPAVGYFANNAAFAKALADGKTSFGTAKTQAAMEAVVRNTMIQGWLSIIFVVLSIVVIITAVMATIKALRNTAAGLPNAEHEDPAQASRVFAPAGFVPTAAERDLVAEWNQLPAGGRLERSGHH